MDTDFVFNKERSVKACIADGWRIFALNWRTYLKDLWVYLLLVGLTGAFLFELSVQYTCEHLLPAYRLTEMGGDPSLVKLIAAPAVTEAVYLLLALLLFIVAILCSYGRMWQMMKHFCTHNQMPEFPLYFSRHERAFALRTLCVNALFTVVCMVLTALVMFAALKWSLWIAAILLPLYIYTASTVCVCEIRFVLKGHSLNKSLRYTLKRSMGIPFIIQFITFIPATVLYVVFCMPLSVYLLSEWAGNSSLLMGDASGLPSFLPFLFFTLNTLGLALSMGVTTIRTWSLALKVG